MTSGYRVAVVGATGAVGVEFLALLEQRKFPLSKLKLLASSRSAGKTMTFKGQKLTLRDWNLQLRQPILLFDGRNTVSVSPQEGFLHPTSELDTLGADRPETKCKLE